MPKAVQLRSCFHKNYSKSRSLSNEHIDLCFFANAAIYIYISPKENAIKEPIPSGNLLHSYWKIHHAIHGKIHRIISTGPFSMSLFVNVYQAGWPPLEPPFLTEVKGELHEVADKHHKSEARGRLRRGGLRRLRRHHVSGQPLLGTQPGKRWHSELENHHFLGVNQLFWLTLRF